MLAITGGHGDTVDREHGGAHGVWWAAMGMKEIGEALEAMLPSFRPLPGEWVALADSAGRHLAEDVRAARDLPPFDNSAMDGYAVRGSEVAGASPGAAVRLPVVGESRAGGAIPEALREGTAMRVFTGAPMPDGSDAVVIQEDTTRDGESVEIRSASSPGRHVRARASDLATGALALPAGHAVGPGEIGLLASQGRAHLHVHRRPVVAIVSTGDELRDVADPAEPGTIVDSNSHALAALVRDAGAESRVLPRAPDDLDASAATLRAALEADLVLTVGGVSVGSYDFVHDAFARVGIEAAFWKVRIKPGKPLTFGVGPGDTPVVGLPGNPVSAMVTFDVFARPGIRRLLGDPAPHPVPVEVVLAEPHRHRTGRLELARARLETDAGRPVARMHGLQGSGSLPSMVGIDAYVLLSGDREHFEAGERLPALPVPVRSGGTRSPFGAG